MTEEASPSRPRERLSRAEARRIAVAAQGFGPRPASTGARRLAAAFERLGLLQIDSVNVLVRSHYLPLFSRLGAYPVGALDKAARGRRRSAFEYWGHEASLMPVSLQPLFRWRMARAAAGRGIYGGLARFAVEQAGYVERVYREVAARGPLAAGELSEGGRGEGGWWGWSDGKRALEYLFWAGRVTTAERRGFERVYGVTETVLPQAIIGLPTPAEEEAQRALLRIAVQALGVATEPCLRDYFRLDPADSKTRVAELVETGELLPVSVEGWDRPAYLDPKARLPRRIGARALLSPFDSLVFERRRTEELFDFHYRLAFYTPAEKRSHGYYVMPFLLGDRLVARIDLKADREAGVLRVLAAHLEAGARAGPVAEALAAELALMTEWLGLSGLAVAERGDLAAALAEAVRRAPG